MYKQILVALDDSPRAPEVLRHAAGLAAHTGARLHLCHAVNVPLGLPADTWALNGEDLRARLIDHGLHELTTLAGDLHPHITPVRWGERVCRLGRPAQVIIDLAEELKVDLIVIGCHSLAVLDRLLGTTAARVVNHACCHVLVVRPEADPPTQGQSA